MTETALAERNPTIGDNNPPNEFVTLKEEIDRYLATADKWLTERPEITDPDMAAKAEDFDAQLRKLEKLVKEKEDAEKRPLMKQLDEIRARFRKLADALSAARGLFKKRREAWLKKEGERIAKEREEKERQAREAREAAERAAREAQEIAEKAEAGELQGANLSVTGSLAQAREAQEIAEKAEAEANAASKEKASVRGDLGGKATGLKTYYRASITDNGRLLAWVKKNRSDELMELLEKIANAAARSPEMRKSGVPGVKFIAEQRL